MPLLSLLTAAVLGQTPAKAVVLRGPALVVLLKDGCPCTRECRLQLNALAGACRGKVKFLGLVDANAGKAQAIVKEAELSFPVVADPRQSLIRSYAGKEALDIRLVNADGKVVARWEGLSRDHVASAVDKVWTNFGQDISMDLAPFTVLTKLGCDFRLP